MKKIFFLILNLIAVNVFFAILTIQRTPRVNNPLHQMNHPQRWYEVVYFQHNLEHSYL